MKKIKSFRLFESNIEREDLLEDIKSLEYIVEDEGYDIKYFYVYGVKEGRILKTHKFSVDRLDDAYFMDGRDFRFIGIDIMISLSEDERVNIKLDDIKHTLNILESSLDRFQRLLRRSFRLC